MANQLTISIELVSSVIYNFPIVFTEKSQNVGKQRARNNQMSHIKELVCNYFHPESTLCQKFP